MNNMLGSWGKPRVEERVVVNHNGLKDLGMLSQDLFIRLLCTECKRTERSGRRFVLMLLDTGGLLRDSGAPVMTKLLTSIAQSTRDTDLRGWYKEGSVIGIIFTEIGTPDNKSVVSALSRKFTNALDDVLSAEEMNQLRLSFHLFPDDWDDDESGPIRSTLRTAQNPLLKKTKVERGAKRIMDVAGSIAGLTLCLPLIALIALAIKMTSKGPVLFRQVRLGQYGKKFTFLKFRSMYVGNNPKIHEEYVKRFIVDDSGIDQAASGDQKLYKLTGDPRVTPIGRLLRSTSLDELPQFLNVLRGEMSLVGPRPPVIYEFQQYNLWHKQRLSAVKPGITGLWQVDGRSRVKFDDMVRLDIRYARSWSIWLDIKILLSTPRAVISGNGAC